jgi:hypothetical protein
MNEWWRASSQPGPWETIVGVPLGLSRDYDRLPAVETPRVVHCSTCSGLHEDSVRQVEDGVKILAGMCKACREEGRETWIAENRADLPRAVARYRR